MRAYDPDSVLARQELYTTPDGRIHEITQDLRLTDDAPYTSRDRCVAAMYTYLLRMHDVSNDQADPAYKDMTNRLSANVDAKA
ncbi:hypothetical protein [Streptomyces sp. NPDC050738]|uniref:hypothetical protein n=1 Tax=Streptomyces sp. NPDC050738 TaxID=3154744 RepID=UPI00341F4549